MEFKEVDLTWGFTLWSTKVSINKNVKIRETSENCKY